MGEEQSSLRMTSDKHLGSSLVFENFESRKTAGRAHDAAARMCG